MHCLNLKYTERLSEPSFFAARYHSLVLQTLMLVDARNFVQVIIFVDVSLLEVGCVT